MRQRPKLDARLMMLINNVVELIYIPALTQDMAIGHPMTQ